MSVETQLEAFREERAELERQISTRSPRKTERTPDFVYYHLKKKKKELQSRIYKLQTMMGPTDIA